MKTYNGHRSWNAWNIALWINNDFHKYEHAINCVHEANYNLKKATEQFMSAYGGMKTHDGAVFNRISVRLALEALIQENTSQDDNNLHTVYLCL